MTHREETEDGRTAEIMAKKMGVSKNTWKDMKTIVTQGTPKQIERMDLGGMGNGASTIAREIRDGTKDGERKCKKCGRILPISEFTAKHNIFVCRDCENKRKRESERKNEPKVMPDSLNPDIKVEITDDIIIDKFANILKEAKSSFKTLLMYETKLNDSILEALKEIIDTHIKEMEELKGDMRNETERHGI